MLADDVKMYVKIVNNVYMGRLQQALTAVTDWAQEWQLGISIDKCCVLNLGIQLSAPHLFINNRELDVVLQARDLGIPVSDSLSPTAHVLDIVSKAHRRAKLILRTFTSQDIGLLYVYTSFMWDHLLNTILSSLHGPVIVDHNTWCPVVYVMELRWLVCRQWICQCCCCYWTDAAQYNHVSVSSTSRSVLNNRQFSSVRRWCSSYWVCVSRDNTQCVCQSWTRRSKYVKDISFLTWLCSIF